MIPVHQNDTFFHSTDSHKLIYFRVPVLSNSDTIYSDGQNSWQRQEGKNRCTDVHKNWNLSILFLLFPPATAGIDGSAPKTLTEKKLKSAEYLWIHLIPGHLRASSVWNPESRSRSWGSTLTGSLATDTWLTPRPTQANSPRDHLRSGFGLWAWVGDVTLWERMLIAFKRI